jgi:hypothetical protein
MPLCNAALLADAASQQQFFAMLDTAAGGGWLYNE